MTSLPSARSVPGIGSSTFKVLESNGLSTVRGIQETAVEFLKSILGNWGQRYDH
jgi:nucleotidyltransferase/DNA polymerase involved in DNA repair